MSSQVSFEKKLTMVHFNPELQTAHRIAAAISDLGFEARVTTIKKPSTGRTRSTQVKRKPKRVSGKLARTVLNVKGMVCTSCVNNIEANIGELNGVGEIRVSLYEKVARVSYHPNVLKPAQLCKAIKELGFDASVAESECDKTKFAESSTCAVPIAAHVDIEVEGMVCKSCVQNIEESLSKKKGVKEIKVSLKEKLASVTYDPKIINPRQVADAIDDLGFEATPLISEAAVSSLSPSPKSLVSVVGIDGMTCHSCVSLIESVIGEISGVTSVRVSLGNKEATIVYDSSEASSEGFKTSIEDMGFIVTGIKSMLVIIESVYDKAFSPYFLVHNKVTT